MTTPWMSSNSTSQERWRSTSAPRRVGSPIASYNGELAKVYAFDVGKGQLDYRLRKDPRVVVREGVNARYPLDLREAVDLAVIDVSFISVTKVIPSAAAALKAASYLVVLVKPQFEAERREVAKGGVVREPEVHARVLGRFIEWATQNGFRVGGLVRSPITGAEGNTEFFVLLRKDEPVLMEPSVTSSVRS